MATRKYFTDYETRIDAAWLNQTDAIVVDGLGGEETPAGVRTFIGAVPEAPSDGFHYARKDGAWATVQDGTTFTAGTALELTAGEVLNNPSAVGGFESRTTTSLAFADNEITLEHLSDYRFWSESVLFPITTDQVFTVPDATAFYLAWIDASGVPQVGTGGGWNSFNECLVASLYFNADYPTEYVLCDERHSFQRNPIAHFVEHKTVGAFINLPGDLAGTFGDTDGSIAIATGSFYDEDLQHVFGSTLTQAKICYKDTTGWRVDALASDFRKLDTGVLQRQNGTALQSVTNNSHVNYWVFGVPEVVGAADATGEIHVLVGQAEYTSAASALTETVDVLDLPPWIKSEARALYRVTLKRTSGVPGGDVYQTATDLRFTKISGGVTVSGAYLSSSLPEGKLWVGSAAGAAVATAVVASGTTTTNDPILTLTQTWNDAAVAFQGLKMDITNTASLAASMLLDLMVGGVSKFSVTRGGVVACGDLTCGVVACGVVACGDVAAYGVAGTDYERGVLDWGTTTNVLTVGAQKGGTGTLRDVNLVGKNVGINTQGGALATTATSGFFMLPSCAGAPTGVPTGIPTGLIAAIVDTTGGDLYLYF